MPDRLPLILVCDDTPAKRYIVSSWLRRDGFRVVEATTAGDARRILQEQPVDLAVLDVHLPDGSGLDITQEVRHDPRLSALPVVHVSAIAVETKDKVAGLDRGADAYLVDPIEPQELISSIRALLRSSGARRHAEALALRMSRLNGAAMRLNLASTVRRLTDALAGAAADVLGEPAVALLADGEDSGDGKEGEVVRRAAAAPGGGVDIRDTLSDAAALVGLPELVTVRRDAAPWTAFLPHSGPREWRLARVSSDGRTVGLVAVPASEVQPNDDFLLGRLSQLTSVALDNLRALQREHQTAMVLQRSLLPASLPELSGLRVAARYRASERYAEVGGDFFDAFEVEDGCFVVIGDVQGHSLQAAVVMAELRYSLRAYAYDGYGPAEITDRVDAVLTRSQPGMIATACIARISADRRSMRLVNAGHPPVLRLRGGQVDQLKPRDVLLGLPATHHEESFDLLPGDRLLLLTDGLVERRDEPLETSLERLGTALARLTEPSTERAADHLLREFGASEDDVALMVVDVLHP